MFPPAPMVAKTLDKIRKSSCTQVILIASQSPSRPWHPILLQLSICPRIPLPDIQLYQFLPHRGRPVFHQDKRLFDLAAWMLPGKPYLRNHTFTEPVVEMASASIRDSSSHLYNTHWKLFTDWLAFKDIPTQSASYHHLADYLVQLFNQNKQVNTA